jgi:hypothetical protein
MQNYARFEVEMITAFQITLQHYVKKSTDGYRMNNLGLGNVIRYNKLLQTDGWKMQRMIYTS